MNTARKTKQDDARAATLATIAREKLGIETLEERHRDALDFHDLGVVWIRRALEAAYEAGRAKRSLPAPPSRTAVQ
jgi:hypothetical protein